jgi:hypothetical protein
MECLDHAELVHDLTVCDCEVCQVEPDKSCQVCAGDVTYFSMNCNPCGRADCPIGRRPA